MSLKDLARMAAYRSGAFRLLQGMNADRARILMYHRFPPKFAENFDAQCAFLAKNYDVISLEEILQRLERGSSLKNLVAITVDDGHADMYKVAFPVLRKHKLPATLFVTTDFINRKIWMPGDAVRFFFAQPRGKFLEVADEKGDRQVFRDDQKAEERLRTLLKRVSNAARARVLDQLSSRRVEAGVTEIPADYAPCTWDELRTMADNGVTMGAHTVTHPILSRVESERDLEAEIAGSKEALERELARPVETFAYPNGTPADVSAAALRIVRKTFQGAVTAVYGINAAGVDRHELLRLPCDPDLPVPQLARMLAGPVRPAKTSSGFVLQQAS